MTTLYLRIGNGRRANKYIITLHNVCTLSHVVWFEDVATPSIGTETTIIEVHEPAFCLVVQSNWTERGGRERERERERESEEKGDINMPTPQ